MLIATMKFNQTYTIFLLTLLMTFAIHAGSQSKTNQESALIRQAVNQVLVEEGIPKALSEFTISNIGPVQRRLENLFL